MKVRCIRPDFSIKIMNGGSSGIEPEYLYTYKRPYNFTNKVISSKIEKILKKLEELSYEHQK